MKKAHLPRAIRMHSGALPCARIRCLSGNIQSPGRASLRKQANTLSRGFSCIKWTRAILEAGPTRKGAQPERVTRTWADVARLYRRYTWSNFAGVSDSQFPYRQVSLRSEAAIMRGAGLKPRRPTFESYFYYFLSVCPWAIYVTSLCLSVFIRKARKIIVPTSQLS